MITLVATRRVEAKSVGARDDISITDQDSMIDSDAKLLWQEARAQAIGFRHDDLVRTHWKKIGRSTLDD